MLRHLHVRRVVMSMRSRLAIYFEPRDIWVGVFVSRKGIAYVCLVPCLVIAWRFKASPPPASHPVWRNPKLRAR